MIPEDSFWKWGLFYYNPKDSRVWLPKRIPWMGFTLNWAKPQAYAYVFALLVWLGLSFLLAY